MLGSLPLEQQRRGCVGYRNAHAVGPAPFVILSFQKSPVRFTKVPPDAVYTSLQIRQEAGHLAQVGASRRKILVVSGLHG